MKTKKAKSRGSGGKITADLIKRDPGISNAVRNYRIDPDAINWKNVARIMRKLGPSISPQVYSELAILMAVLQEFDLLIFLNYADVWRDVLEGEGLLVEQIYARQLKCAMKSIKITQKKLVRVEKSRSKLQVAATKQKNRRKK